MSTFFQRFSLRSIKFNSLVITTLVILWIAVLSCVISSILAQPFSKRQRTFWLVVVVSIPLLGVLAYLPFSFNKEDLPHIFLAKAKKKKKTRERNPFDSTP